jgi:hypothetical protein
MANPQFQQLVLSENHHYFHNDSQKCTDYEQLLSKLAEFRIADMVLSLRQQRHPGIVQTKQQYKFIYSTLVDEICHPTTVSDACAKVMLSHEPSSTAAVMKHRQQYQKLNQSCPVLKRLEKEESTNNNESKEENSSSNDLAYILDLKNQKTKIIKQQEKKGDVGQSNRTVTPAQSEQKLVSSGMVSPKNNNNNLTACQDDRTFLCKSSPMVFAL